MKNNFHNHTFRCHHAGGSDEDYVVASIENGFETIGFSDHCAWRFEKRDFVSGMRMREDEIPGYVDSVKALQKKYDGKIRVLLGWEVEYFPKYMPWMKETLEAYAFDYIILGHHFSEDEMYGDYNGSLTGRKQIERYADELCAAMETGEFAYVAHPDLFMKGYHKFDKTAHAVSQKIIETAIRTKTPLEFNLLGVEYSRLDGIDGYPFPSFWRLAGEMGATAILGLDAHQPEKYANSELIRFGEKTLAECELKTVDCIKLRRT